MLIILLVTSIAPLVRAAGQESTSLQDKTLVVWAAASSYWSVLMESSTCLFWRMSAVS